MMAIAKAGKLNTTNVNRLARQLGQNPAARAEAATLMRRNFHKFVETAFELTPAQQAEMRSGMPKPLADVVGRACAVVIENKGRVEYRVEKVKQNPDLRIEIYHQDDEWGVRITWEK